MKEPSGQNELEVITERKKRKLGTANRYNECKIGRVEAPCESVERKKKKFEQLNQVNKLNERSWKHYHQAHSWNDYDFIATSFINIYNHVPLGLDYNYNL